jgi:hypothetical protein
VDRSLQDRHRLEFRVGYWDAQLSRASLPTVTAEEWTRVENVTFAISYSHWLHDKLATDVSFRALIAEATVIERPAQDWENAVLINSATIGFRLYPISSRRTPLRPYITAGVGPYIGVEYRRDLEDRDIESMTAMGTVGSYAGGGLDIQMGRHMMAGLRLEYNSIVDFPDALAGQRNHSGLEFSAGISVLIGRGKPY